MAKVRVWHDADRLAQHIADPPEDDVSHEWQGVTSCGLDGTLHWVHGEQVDTGNMCLDCFAAEGGVRPPLEGDYPGPP